MTETNTYEWGGWELTNNYVIRPQRILLRKSEARILAVLMQHRGNYVDKIALHAATMKGGHLNTMYSIISTLRDAIGRTAVFTSREYGYKLLRATDTHGNVRDPLDEMIENLENALAAAKRLKHTREKDK